MTEAFLKSYRCLSDIFRKRAFSNIELNEVLNGSPVQIRPLITKLVYGVLDLNIRYDFVIDKFAEKIKPAIGIILKIGLYAFENLNIPQAVVVDETVRLAKNAGKGGVSGFVNAFMRRSTDALKRGEVDFGSVSPDSEAVANGFPVWAARMLTKQYGLETAKKIISYRETEGRSHIRLNTDVSDALGLEAALKRANVLFEKSPIETGYFVKGSLNAVPKNIFTVQSAGSMAVTLAWSKVSGKKCLDLCAAPGGKSIFLAQLKPDIEIVACDKYDHRAALIEKYAKRMGVRNLSVRINDATVPRPQFFDAFDSVLCDAPCSGFGVCSSKPDIKFLRAEADIETLSELQYKILNTAKNYVKRGGSLIYSTCTYFEKENEQVVNRFLKNNSEFETAELFAPYETGAGRDKTIQFLPHRDGIDGFFMARLIRKF